MSRNQSIYAVMVVIAVMVVAFFVGSLTVSAATITVNSNNGNDDGGVDGECNFGEAVVSINTGGDYGDCVADVTNPYGTSDTVEFSIGGGGAQVISFSTKDWDGSFEAPIYINGLTQPAGGGDPATCGTTDMSDRNLLISFDLNQTADFRFEFEEGSAGSTVRGIHLFDADQSGMYLQDDDITIACNHIGTNLAGTAVASGLNAQQGFRVGDQSLTFGVKDGITIGGPLATDGNVISGNTCEALHLSGNGLSNLTIQNNMLGVGVDGTTAIGNGAQAINVQLDDATSTYTTVTITDNVISNNGDVTITQPLCGITAGQNFPGVQMERTTGLVFSDNIVSDNETDGIQVLSTSSNVTIQGNTFTDNAADGISLDDVVTATIGGTGAGEGNTITGHGSQGIEATNSTTLTIENNTLSGNSTGIQIIGGNGITIGGSTSAERNVIFNNSTAGIIFTADGTTAASDVTVQNNYIGIEADGTTLNTNSLGILAIAADGLFITENNIYSAVGDAIAMMSLPFAMAMQDISLINNSIYGGASILAFDLAADTVGDFTVDTLDGVNPNDAGDTDEGSNVGFAASNNLNHLLNYPEFTSVETSSGSLTTDVEYTLDVPAGDYRVEFFQNSALTTYGQGETFLDYADITHTGSGAETFTKTLNVTVGDYIAATATERGLANFSTYGATSEFSAIATITEEVVVDTSSGSSGGTSYRAPEHETCEFDASETVINAGESVTLSWETDIPDGYYTTAEISPIGDVNGDDGSIVVTPEETTTYRAKFDGLFVAHTCTARETVTVIQPDPEPEELYLEEITEEIEPIDFDLSPVEQADLAEEVPDELLEADPIETEPESEEQEEVGVIELSNTGGTNQAPFQAGVSFPMMDFAEVFENGVIKIGTAIGLALGFVTLLATTAFAGPLAAPELVLIPFRLWTMLLSALGIKKKEKAWGVAYDAKTKQPLDPVYISLQDEQGNEIKSAITDLDGRYGFTIDKPGTYKIVAGKSNYAFPSKVLSGNDHDHLYQDLYFGELFTVSSAGETIIKNIPMDNINFNWNEHAKADMEVMKFYKQRDYTLTKLGDILFGAGFVITAIALTVNPMLYNIVMFVMYVLLGIVRQVGVPYQKFASVVDTDGNPVPYVLVTVYSSSTNREVKHTVADKYGRFHMILPNGLYHISIERPSGQDEYEPFLEYSQYKVKNGVLRGELRG